MNSYVITKKKKEKINLKNQVNIMVYLEFILHICFFLRQVTLE